MIEKDETLETLRNGPAYFKLRSGKYKGAISRVEYLGEGRDEYSHFWLTYSPTWEGLRSLADLQEETWFIGSKSLEELISFLNEADALPKMASEIENWIDYFEGTRRSFLKTANQKVGSEVRFALATWSLQGLFREISIQALKSGSRMGFRSLRSILRARKLSTDLDFVLALSAALKMSGLGLALVPLNTGVTCKIVRIEE